MTFIKTLKMNVYGKWVNQTIPFEPGINLIYGANESGKSTVLDAIKTTLYGFSSLQKSRHPYAHWQTERLDFSAEISRGEELFSVARRLMSAPQFHLVNEFTKTFEKKRNEPLPWLNGTSVHLFQSVFCPTAEELSGFESLSWEQIQDRLLFNYEVSYLNNPKEVIKSLEQEINVLWRNDKRGNPEMANLKSQLLDLEQKKKQIEMELDTLKELESIEKAYLEQLQGLNEKLLMLQKEQKRLIALLPIANQTKAKARLESLMVEKALFETMSPDSPARYESLKNEQMAMRNRVAALFDQLSEQHHHLLGKWPDDQSLDRLLKISREQMMSCLEQLRHCNQGRPKPYVSILLSVLMLTGVWLRSFWLMALGGIGILTVLFKPLVILPKKKQRHLRHLRDLMGMTLPKAMYSDGDGHFIMGFEKLFSILDQWAQAKSDLDKAELDAGEYQMLSKQFKALGRGNEAQGLENFFYNQSIKRQLTEMNVLHATSAFDLLDLDFSDVSEDRLTEVQTLHDDLSKQRETLGHEMHLLKQRKATLSSFETYDETLMAIAEVKGKLKDTIEKRDVLMVVKTLLEQADETFKAKHQPNVIKRVGTYLAAITRGKYHALYVDENHKTPLMYLKTTEGYQPLSKAFSKGTVHQLYFAFRLALMEELDPTCALPMVLDEVFVNWDMVRLKACVPLIKDISKTRQIFIATCHASYLECFEDAHVVRLSEEM